MKRLILLVAALFVGCWLFAQDRDGRRLPSGRLQSDVILEQEHQKTVEDVTELAKLAEELKKEIEESNANVFSIEALRKAERIESLAKDVQNRLKRD